MSDTEGRFIGYRFFVVDGSGGSLSGTSLLRDQQSIKIQEKVGIIKKNIAARQTLSAPDCLRSVNTVAELDANAAYAAVVVVDILPGSILIARRGDPPVVRFNGGSFSTRRGEGWPANQRGGPGNFQLIDVPQNMAHALKVGGLGAKTTHIDETPESSLLYAGVVSRQGSIQSLKIERSFQEEFLLVMSDGGRGGSNLLVPEDSYSRKVKGVMLALKNGTINETAAAEQIAKHAREIPGEDDDITVLVIRIPPKTPPFALPTQDPQSILAEHERGARKRGTPALHDRAHGTSWTKMG